MQIVCPNCAAAYQVTTSAIGAGRSVRCVRCRTVWHQQALDQVPLNLTTPVLPASEPANEAAVDAFRSELGNEPQAAPPSPAAVIAPTTVSENGDPAGPSLDQLITPATAAEPAAAGAEAAQPDQAPATALSEITIPAEQAPPTAPEADATVSSSDAPANIESTAERRRRIKRGTARRRISSRFARTPAVILALACIVAALIAWRGTIVRHAPQMASLYAAVGMPVNLRGLAFSEVKVSRDTHDGVAVLVVEGTVTSVASKLVEVPRLRFAMRNETGSEIYAWTAMPTREVLGPGEVLPFRSRLASPPGEGKDVTVRFFNRLDAVAGLR